MKAARLVLGFGMALFLVTATTACTSQSHTKENAMQSAPEARGAMQEFVRDTIAIAGGTWTSENGDPSPDECTLTDGSKGVSFSWNHEADGASDPETIAKTVGAHWKKLGYSTSYRQGAMNPDGTLYSVIGEGPAVKSISVNASRYRVSLHVDSACGTGDIDEYLDQLIDPSFRD